MYLHKWPLKVMVMLLLVDGRDVLHWCVCVDMHGTMVQVHGVFCLNATSLQPCCIYHKHSN